MYKGLLLLFCSLILLAGCTPTRQLTLTDMSKEDIALPFKIDTLIIIDKRDTLLPMNWDKPLMTIKNRAWKGNPELSEMHRNDIESIIRRTEKKDGIPVNIEFRVIKGLCEIKGDWKSETEFAKFRGEISLEIPSRDLTYKFYAEMFYENPTLNGTEKGTMRLYNQAVKNVAHILMKQIRDEIKM